MGEVLGLLLKTLGSVLAIGAVVLVAQSISKNNSINNDISNLTMLSQNVQALYQGGAYSTLTNTIALNAGIVPASLNIGGIIQTPSGYAVTLGVNAAVTKFDLTLAGVAKDACVKFATMLKPASLTVGGTAVSLPADPGTVSALCTDSNSMVFTN